MIGTEEAVLPKINMGEEFFAVFSDMTSELMFFRDGEAQVPMIGSRERILSLIPLIGILCEKNHCGFKIYKYKSELVGMGELR